MVAFPFEVIEELREQNCSLRYNNPMDINFLLNHPDEEHISTEEEILERITNPMPLAEDDDDDDSSKTQPIYVDDVDAMLNQLHNLWFQQPNTDNDFTRVIQKIKGPCICSQTKIA